MDLPRTTLRVGHQGARRLAPGNTLRGVDLAASLGVDAVELDVVAADERLVVAHDRLDARRNPHPALDEALAHLRAPGLARLRLLLDLKAPAIEGAVLAALDAHGMLGRTLLTSKDRRVLARLRAHAPTCRVGWSIEWARHAGGGLRPRRAAVLGGVRAALEAREVDAITAHRRLVASDLREVVRAAGGELFVWTVNRRAEAARLTALGVDGIISDDPRVLV
jgi:glycerophosphoryl diester phosphodiesterase